MGIFRRNNKRATREYYYFSNSKTRVIIMKYVKVTRSDKVCNICRKECDSLSFDHVPPKGGINLSDMDVINYSNMYLDLDFKHRDVLQSGIRFRTVCRECNSQLGTKYDDCFNTFTKDVKSLLLSELILPGKTQIETNPTKVIKSLLGHILSSKVEYCDSKYDNIIREYIVNEKAILPKSIKIYFWTYRYNCTIIKNDIILFLPLQGIRCTYSLLKFFPLAFAILFEGEMDGVEELTSYNSDNNDEKRLINIQLNQILPFNFPESNEKDGLTLTQQKTNNIFAIPRSKKNQ